MHLVVVETKSGDEDEGKKEGGLRRTHLPGIGGILKVGVLEGLFGGEAAGGVVSEELGEEGEAEGAGGVGVWVRVWVGGGGWSGSGGGRVVAGSEGGVVPRFQT